MVLWGMCGSMRAVTTAIGRKVERRSEHSCSQTAGTSMGRARVRSCDLQVHCTKAYVNANCWF